jgi:hypothetical protein
VYLLRYKRDGEWRLVVIADAYSVAHARMLAAGLEPGIFVNGHRVSRTSLPIDAGGRVLTLADLMVLVEGKKKPPAPSVGGRAGLGRRHGDGQQPNQPSRGNGHTTFGKSGHRA